MPAPKIGETPLMSYASDIAEGAGRTPIGILLFAASHVLLGGFLLWMGWPFAQHALLRGKPDGEALFALIVLSTATPMTIGGGMLLLKGRFSWLASIAAHGLLAFMESVLAAYGFGLAVWRSHRQDDKGTLVGVIAGVVGILLLGLCLIVLRYLSLPKARNTFGLPPGESSAIFRWLPLGILILGLFVIAIGIMIGSTLR